MHHRHINYEDFNLVAIDDVISRGVWKDWADLRRAALKNTALLEDIRKICLHYIADPYEQRYHFWMNYVKKHSAS